MTVERPTTYVILLRGVNVGGVAVKMAELRAILKVLPIDEVETVLASGNVVGRSRLPAGELKIAVEGALRSELGYEAWVVVLKLERLRELAAAVPYPADDPATHSYVTFGSNAGVLTDLFDAASEAEPNRSVSDRRQQPGHAQRVRRWIPALKDQFKAAV